MGKKKRKIMDEMRAVFLDGAAERGVARRDAEAIFDNMAEFAGYCFNKPHSAMYGIIAYYTAYLKTNYTAEFMAAQLTSFADRKDRVALYIEEARKLGVEVRSPHINESDADFTVDSEGHIRFGLAAIKGVGLAAVAGILEARAEAPFAHLFALCERAPANAVNRAVLECLIRAGAFDQFGSRAAHLAALDSALAIRQQLLRERDSGQAGLFDDEEDPALNLAAMELPQVADLDRKAMLDAEKDLLGFYVSENPLQQLGERLAGRATFTGSTIAHAHDGDTVIVGGIVTDVRPRQTKRGDTMAFVTLLDHEGEMNLVVFGRQYEESAKLLKVDSTVLVKGKCQRREGSNRSEEIVVDRVKALPEHPKPGAVAAPPPPPRAEPAASPPEPDENGAPYDPPPADEDAPPPEEVSEALPPGSSVHIRVPGRPDEVSRVLKGFHELLVSHSGEAPVFFHVPDNGGERIVRLGDQYRVEFGPAFRSRTLALGVPPHNLWVESEP